MDRKCDYEIGSMEIKKWEKEYRFGLCTKLRTKDGAYQLQKEKVTNSNKQCIEDIETISARIKINHPQLQTCIDWSSETNTTLCSNFYKIKGFYEWPLTDLSLINTENIKNKCHMNSIELLDCATQCLNGLCYLHKNGYFFEDLRPIYIGKRVKTFEWILLDRLSDPSPAETYQITVLMENKDIYMSPQLFESQINKKKVNYNKKKADCWSLGQCILETGLSSSIQDIYNKRTGKMDECKLSHYFKEFKEIHSNNDLLCILLENLLIIDEKRRYTCCELLEALNCSESEIFDRDSDQKCMSETASPQFKRNNSVEVQAPKNILMNYKEKIDHCSEFSPNNYENHCRSKLTFAADSINKTPHNISNQHLKRNEIHERKENIIKPNEIIVRERLENISKSPSFFKGRENTPPIATKFLGSQNTPTPTNYHIKKNQSEISVNKKPTKNINSILNSPISKPTNRNIDHQVSNPKNIPLNNQSHTQNYNLHNSILMTKTTITRSPISVNKSPINVSKSPNINQRNIQQHDTQKIIDTYTKKHTPNSNFQNDIKRSTPQIILNKPKAEVLENHSKRELNDSQLKRSHSQIYHKSNVVKQKVEVHENHFRRDINDHELKRSHSQTYHKPIVAKPKVEVLESNFRRELNNHEIKRSHSQTYQKPVVVQVSASPHNLEIPRRSSRDKTNHKNEKICYEIHNSNFDSEVIKPEKKNMVPKNNLNHTTVEVKEKKVLHEILPTETRKSVPRQTIQVVKETLTPTIERIYNECEEVKEHQRKAKNYTQLSTTDEVQPQKTEYSYQQNSFGDHHKHLRTDEYLPTRSNCSYKNSFGNSNILRTSEALPTRTDCSYKHSFGENTINHKAEQTKFTNPVKNTQQSSEIFSQHIPSLPNIGYPDNKTYVNFL